MTGSPAAAAAPAITGPDGLGVAVVFDWAIAAQLTTQGIAAATGHLGQSGGVVAGLLPRLLGAGLLIALGEALRRGWPVARILEVMLTGALAIAGAGAIAVLVARGGGRGLVASAIIQVTFAPFIALRLSTARSRAWFATACGHGGAPRTSGGGWVACLVGWSALWGVFVAWSQSL